MFIPRTEKKWYSTYDSKPQGEWDRVAELMMIKFRESGHPVLRETSPFSWGTLKSKGGGKCSTHFWWWYDGNYFREIISVNQLSIHGAVSDLCGERAIWPIVRANKLIGNDTCTSIEILGQENLLQKHKERVEKLPQPDQLTKICVDAGFLKTVEVGQYFMTNVRRVLAICRASDMCTVPRDEKIIWPERLDSREHQLEVTTSCLQGEHGVEITIESANKDNSHSWTEFLMACTKSQTSRRPLQRRRKYSDQRLKQNREDLQLPRTVPFLERKMDRYWTRKEIEHRVPSGKKNENSSSTRRTTSRRRWCDRILESERLSSESSCALSTWVWWCIEEQDGRRRSQQEKIPVLYWSIRTRNSLSQSSWRSLRTQSHWSFIAGQCINSERFLREHWMCNQFTFHHKFRMDSGRTKFKQGKTDGILYSRESHE